MLMYVVRKKKLKKNASYKLACTVRGVGFYRSSNVIRKLFYYLNLTYTYPISISIFILVSNVNLLAKCVYSHADRYFPSTSFLSF